MTTTTRRCPTPFNLTGLTLLTLLATASWAPSAQAQMLGASTSRSSPDAPGAGDRTRTVIDDVVGDRMVLTSDDATGELELERAPLSLPHQMARMTVAAAFGGGVGLAALASVHVALAVAGTGMFVGAGLGWKLLGAGRARSVQEVALYPLMAFFLVPFLTPVVVTTGAAVGAAFGGASYWWLSGIAAIAAGAVVLPFAGFAGFVGGYYAGMMLERKVLGDPRSQGATAAWGLGLVGLTSGAMVASAALSTAVVVGGAALEVVPAAIDDGDE